MSQLTVDSASVQLNQADLERFSKFARKSAKERWWTWLALISAMAFFAGVFANLTPSANKHRTDAGQLEPEPQNYFAPKALWRAWPVILFLGILGYYLWKAKRPSTYEAYAPGIFQPKIFEVTDQGFLSRGEKGESLTSWKFIVRFAETNEDFYVMLAARNGHALPKHCFSTLESMAIFRNQMLIHLQLHAPAALVEGKL